MKQPTTSKLPVPGRHHELPRGALMTLGRRSSPRVFVGLSDVAGHFSSIAASLRSAGVDARFYNLSANPLSYGTSTSRTGRLMALRYAPQGSVRSRVWSVLLRANRLVRRGRSMALFPWAVLRFDAFVLGGHETFLGGADLWMLRRLGKPVVVIFTGSDHRPPYLSGIGVRDFPDTRSLAAATRRTRERVRRAERGSAAIVALPASAQLHRRPFVDFLAIGIPFTPPDALETERPDSEAGKRRPIRVLHSPSEPGPKGTPVIREVVERCRANGLDLEYRELIGRPNVEVLRALSWCDFIIDELYSDTPMAKFATEAAYFGKPAIVGSYAGGLYSEARPSLPPAHLCRPDDLEQALVKLATDDVYRTDLGRRAREFVLRAWLPEEVGKRLLRVIAGDIPAEWIVDPAKLTYAHGWGMSEAAVRGVLRRMIADEGFESLQLAPDSSVASSIRALVVDP